MDNKRIKLQKSAASFTTIFLVMILGFTIIGGAFYFMTAGAERYGAIIPDVQNETFTDLQTSQNALESNIQNISNSVGNITVQTGLLQTFWNSFVGLGAILQLPISLIDVGITSTSTLLLGTDVVPPWMKSLIKMLIIILIILAIVAAMTGGNSNI